MTNREATRRNRDTAAARAEAQRTFARRRAHRHAVAIATDVHGGPAVWDSATCDILFFLGGLVERRRQEEAAARGYTLL